MAMKCHVILSRKPWNLGVPAFFQHMKRRLIAPVTSDECGWLSTWSAISVRIVRDATILFCIRSVGNPATTTRQCRKGPTPYEKHLKAGNLDGEASEFAPAVGGLSAIAPARFTKALAAGGEFVSKGAWKPRETKA